MTDPGVRVGRHTLLERGGWSYSEQYWLALCDEPFEPERPVHIQITFRHREARETPDEHEALARARQEHLALAAGGAWPILESGWHDGNLWHARPWLEGASVSSLLKAAAQQEATLDLAVALAIVKEVAHAFARLPDTDPGPPWPVDLRMLWVTWSGQVLFHNWNGPHPFETFKIEQPFVGITPEDVRSGTGQSPGPPPVERRRDVFVLAEVLFVLLTGRPIAPGQSLIAQVDRVMAGDVESVSDARPGLHADIAKLINDGLLPRPGDRPSLAAATAELERLAAAHGAPDAEGLATVARQLRPDLHEKHQARAEAWSGLMPDTWRQVLLPGNETPSGGT
jgi:hypothetical protein